MKLNELFHPYYITNLMIVLVYPMTRILKLFRFTKLDQGDELGFTRENSLFYTIMAFIIIKWLKRYSTMQFLGDVFFTIKLALITGYALVSFQVVSVYIGACLVQWLLFKQPQYRGPTAIIQIKSLQEYEDYLGIDIKIEEDVIEDIKKKYEKNTENDKSKKKKKQQQKQYNEISQQVFCEFYVSWADTCTYTKEIWAEYSLKYTTNRLNFISVDLQRIPKLAEVYQINTSSVSRQLPTVILFENGQEIQRFPPIEKKTGRIGKVLKYDRKEIQKFFDLEKRYLTTRDQD